MTIAADQPKGGKGDTAVCDSRVAEGRSGGGRVTRGSGMNNACSNIEASRHMSRRDSETREQSFPLYKLQSGASLRK